MNGSESGQPNGETRGKVQLHEWRLKALEENVGKVLEMQGKILHRLDTLPCSERAVRTANLEDDVQTLHGDVETLKREARVWSSFNSVAALVAGVFGLSGR